MLRPVLWRSLSLPPDAPDSPKEFICWLPWAGRCPALPGEQGSSHGMAPQEDKRHHLEHLPLLLWHPQHGTSLCSAWVSGPGCVSSLKHLQLCVAEHCLQLKHHCVITAMFKDPKPSTIPATKKKINSIPDTQLSLWLNHFSPSSSPSPAVCYAVILM